MAAKVCGICTFVEHPTDMCPTLQETGSDQLENVGAIGGFQYEKQLYQIAWKTTISTRTESRPLCNSTIRIHTECISKTSRLSIVDSAISSATFPTTAITENAVSRQFPISGGSNEAASYQQSGVPTICELQQRAIPAKYDHHHPRPQDIDSTSAGSSNLPSQTIPNLRRTANAVTLRSGKELPQPVPQLLSRLAEADSKPFVDSQSQQDKTIPKSFLTQTISARKPKSDEELLKMF
ncbi:hypothetical protein CR513_23496, partial [Mucuna pruriens]